jgi:hypothetical protein
LLAPINAGGATTQWATTSFLLLLSRHIVRIGVNTFLGSKEGHIEGGESVTLLYTTSAKP